MDNISQKSINMIIELLEKSGSKGKNLAKELKSAEIIPALYVMTYLQAVDKMRKDTQVLEKSSEFAKKYKLKKNDFEGFKKALVQNYKLELDHLVDTPEKFEGAMWLLYTALDRKNKFCDYDDTKLSHDSIGKCEYEDHAGKNPNNQKLSLVLGYDDDAGKFTDDGSIYACKVCEKEINENSEGSVSCDME